ncbi:MAG: hypothetical protein LBE36_06880 [Flavobacteriaceae bacterium]|jgi:hypothetical protein|nr:hypothetical protein [Flavobacteriaceae bacterium]
MKVVSTRNSFLILIFCIPLAGCFKKEKIEATKDGFFVKYPFIEEKTFLILNQKMRFEMNKILTKNSGEYDLGFERKKRYPIPFNRDVNDYSPTFDTELNLLIEKGFHENLDSSFVIKYEYGTGHVEWNYLFKVKKDKIYLESLFYIEPYNSHLNDTIAYISKIHINKSIENLDIAVIGDSMSKAEEREVKHYKYVLKNNK